MIEIILQALAAVPLIALAVLIMHWAFGGKKDNKKKNEKLFETTAFLSSKAPWGMLAPRDRSDIEKEKRS